MRHRMTDSEALRFVLPKKLSDQRTLLRIGSLVVVIAACAAGLYYNNHRQKMIREQDWTSAIATIEDGLTQVALHVDSPMGGAMLYAVEVLAQYPAGGGVQERWIPIHQPAQPLADAQLQIFRLKKQQCIVRWNPADLNQIVAEIK